MAGWAGPPCRYTRWQAQVAGEREEKVHMEWFLIEAMLWLMKEE